MGLLSFLSKPRRVAKRWRLKRKEIEADQFGKSIPHWARHLMIGGYREQGWAAFDQNQNGKSVASGAWGEEIYFMQDGSISCTAIHQRNRPCQLNP